MHASQIPKIDNLKSDFVIQHFNDSGAKKSVNDPSWGGNNNHHTSGEIEHDDIPKLITDEQIPHQHTNMKKDHVGELLGKPDYVYDLLASKTPSGTLIDGGTRTT